MPERSVTAFVSALALALVIGCGSKESVILSARVEAPALTVTGNSLVTDVAGSFDLELSLGDRASDPTTVKLGTFSLMRGGDVLLNPLELDTNPAFPLSIGVGKSKHVEATVMNPDEPTELAEELCAAELQIVGTLTDSLGDDRPRTLTSDSFLPDCP